MNIFIKCVCAAAAAVMLLANVATGELKGKASMYFDADIQGAWGSKPMSFDGPVIDLCGDAVDSYSGVWFSTVNDTVFYVTPSRMASRFYSVEGDTVVTLCEQGYGFFVTSVTPSAARVPPLKTPLQRWVHYEGLLSGPINYRRYGIETLQPAVSREVITPEGDTIRGCKMLSRYEYGVMEMSDDLLDSLDMDMARFVTHDIMADSVAYTRTMHAVYAPGLTYPIVEYDENTLLRDGVAVEVNACTNYFPPENYPEADELPLMVLPEFFEASVQPQDTVPEADEQPRPAPSRLRVSPGVFSGFIELADIDPGTGSVVISDIKGRVWYTGVLEYQTDCRILTGYYPPGIYLVTVETPTGSVSYRLAKP